MEEENITVTEAIELLFGSASLQQAIQAEDEADCDVSAGLDWDNQAYLAFIQNPALLGRLTELRVSLNCEIQRLLAERNLGVGKMLLLKLRVCVCYLVCDYLNRP